MLFAFNRPDHIKQVIQQLRLAAPTRLYLHCDGPRPHRPEDAAKVAAVRQVFSTEIDWPCEVKTLFREENWGLRRSLYDALNWFFQQEESGIFLEDDCVPDLSMFPFCAELLDKYRDDTEIMHIGCTNWIEERTKHLPESYVFTQFPLVTGWATWRRAWQKMSLELAGLDEFEQSGGISRLVRNRMGQVYVLDKFRTTQQGKNHSWAYAWNYSILKNKGLCIVSKVNLIQNIGFGEPDATNTKSLNKDGIRPASSLSFPLIHPQQRTPDPELEKAFFYVSQKGKYRLWLWFLLKKLGLR